MARGFVALLLAGAVLDVASAQEETGPRFRVTAGPAFGTVGVGGPTGRSLTLTNTGMATLRINSITAPAGSSRGMRCCSRASRRRCP